MRTVAICGGGPSMTKKVADAVLAAGVYSIVTNNTWKLAPTADALFAADADWWLIRDPRVSPDLDQFKGERFVCEKQRVREATYVKPRAITVGSNSALQAAYYAMDKGAKRLLLCGIDLRDDEITHWHGQHQGLNNPTETTFCLCRKTWDDFSKLKDRPEVINCSMRSAVECFPKMTIEDALNEAV